MGLKFDDYQFFKDYFTRTGAMEKTSMFIHLASDPVVECVLVPDMALAAAEQFAIKDKNVLVLLTDMMGIRMICAFLEDMQLGLEQIKKEAAVRLLFKQLVGESNP